MRIQVRIPPDIWDKLNRVAQAEHRPPKYQIELLLWDAIEQTAQLQSAQSQPQEVTGASD